MNNPVAASRGTWTAVAPPATMVALTSGKGGVGKSTIATNLAVCLAQRGRRVRLVDTDLALGNVDLLTNVHCRHTLADVVSGRKRLDEVIEEGPHGLEIVGTASGCQMLADLGDSHRQRLIHEVAQLRQDADFLIIDTAAGISRSVVAFCLAADAVWVVTTPEAPAMADAYALIKVLVRSGFAGLLHLVVNLADDPRQARSVHLKMANVVHRFLDTQLHYAGTLLRDEHMVAAVRARRPAVTAYPRSPTAAAIQAMALRLGERPVLKAETRPFLRKVVNWLC